MPDVMTRAINNKLFLAMMEVPFCPNVDQDLYRMTIFMLKENECCDAELDTNREIKVTSLLKNKMLVHTWLVDNIIPSTKGLTRKHLIVYHHLQRMGRREAEVRRNHVESRYCLLSTLLMSTHNAWAKRANLLVLVTKLYSISDFI